MRKLFIAFVTASIFLCAGYVSAAIHPVKIFSDHMVLQREIPVPIWGKGDVGQVERGFEQYAATSVRQIVLLYDSGEYAEICEALEKIKTAKDLETHTDAATYAIKSFDE